MRVISELVSRLFSKPFELKLNPSTKIAPGDEFQAELIITEESDMKKAIFSIQ